jgi:hypothetical protein
VYVLSTFPLIRRRSLAVWNVPDIYRGLVALRGNYIHFAGRAILAHHPSGTVVPLTNPEKPADFVIGHAQEAIHVENLFS